MNRLLVLLIVLASALQGQSIIGFEATEKPTEEKNASVSVLEGQSGAIPHLAFGGTWTTELTAVNTSQRLAKMKWEFFAPNGSRMSVRLQEMATGQIIQGNTFQVVLDVAASTTFQCYKDWLDAL